MKILNEITKSIKQRGDVRANRSTLKCMAITFFVYSIAWLLNVLHVFIVDNAIMNRGLISMFIFFVVIYPICKIMGFDNPKTKYVVMFCSVVLWSYLIMILSYHVLLIIIFPLMCSLQYREKKMMIYTYILTMIGIAAATLAGFRLGLCDANMLLLTYGKTALHKQLLQSGSIVLNDDMFSIFLFFVFPRWLLISAFVPVMNNVVRDIEDSVAQEAVARRRASIDDMTGVYNKNKYLAMVSDYYPTVAKVSVIFWDVNHLKEINDEYGHETGDQLIAAVSESIIRYQNEKNKVYRIGGDEFLLIGENLEAGDVEGIISDWKKRTVGMQIMPGVPASSAVGFAEGAGADIEKVIKEADKNMYRNKKMTQ